jgi:hypothetical protein
MKKPRTPFRIVPKRDFGSGPGYWMPNAGTTGTGKYGFVKHGYVVTDGLCNIMPAATWFQSIPEALDALAIYCGVHGNGQQFWRSLR